MSELENTEQQVEVKKKKKKKSPVILLILMLICIGVFAFSAYKIISQKLEDSEGEEVYREIDQIAGMDDDVKETIIAEPDAEYIEKMEKKYGKDLPEHIIEREMRGISIRVVDFEALRKKNSDVSAWIEMQDTVINYPVAQAENNDKYLRHLLNGSYHRFGTLFFDYRNDLSGDKLNDDITYIYGHNIRAGDMFHTLQFFTKKSFYEEHPFYVLYLPNATYRVDLFAMTVINEYTKLRFDYPDDPQKFLDGLKDRSVFKCDVEVTPEDQIVGLFTCTNDDHSERYILYGKIVPLAVVRQNSD